MSKDKTIAIAGGGGVGRRTAQFLHDRGQKVVNELLAGGVRTMEASGGDLENLDSEISPEAPAAGRQLENGRLAEGSLVISHATGDRVSGAETVLEQGDRYLLAVEAAVTEDVMNILRG